ncbi:hypothetical protein KEM54_004589, partial [Ascosphaera aggregata]
CDYGCPAANLPVEERATHESQCVFARLAPFLETQQLNMKKMEKDIKHLRQRNEVLEELLGSKIDKMDWDGFYEDSTGMAEVDPAVIGNDASGAGGGGEYCETGLHRQYRQESRMRTMN